MGVTKLELMVLREPQISGIRAREVLDCRGLPTVQVDVVVDGRFLGRADVPAGRSRGRHEPVELRDGGSRFGGFGVQRAVSSVRDVLAPALVGTPAVPQRQVDVRHDPGALGECRDHLTDGFPIVASRSCHENPQPASRWGFDRTIWQNRYDSAEEQVERDPVAPR